MIELEEAVALTKASLAIQTKTETVSLLKAVGRVLASDIVAAVDVPAFPRSGMDGYAVFSKETRHADKNQPKKLKVVGILYASDDPQKIKPQKNSAVKIMTGAVIPAGYDAVVRQEETNGATTEVEIYQAAYSGENYEEIGGDIQKNQLVLEKNTCVTSESIGVLASLGIGQVEVFQPLRVGFVATGNELKKIGEPLATGEIYNATSYTLASYVAQGRNTVVFQEISDDQPENLVEILKKYANEVDLIITTGGVSVGEKDFVPAAMMQLGAEKLFHGVRIKPGMPVMASCWQDKLILSLSGNPFASMVNFHLFYWSILAHFFQNNHFQLRQSLTTIGNGEMQPSKIRRFVRGTIKNGVVDIPEKGHDASVFHNMVENNCLIEQPAGKALEQGQKVVIYSWQ